MAGLGSVEERDYVYLSIAGGKLWNKKADKSDPDYAEQTYRKTDDQKGEPDSGLRKGAQYAHIDGKVLNVTFRQHERFGESINIRMDIGLDKDYIVSVSTNNRYSQDLMKALLNADLTKTIYIKPYDFIGQDKKRASGCTFKQGGQKIELKVDESPSQDKEWWKNATAKAKKRFFEDLNDWFVAQVEEFVVPKLDAIANAAPKTEAKPEAKQESKDDVEQEQEQEQEQETTQEEKVEDKPDETPASKTEEKEYPSPIKMKRAIKDYIAENYEGEELPKLKGDALKQWYDLVLEEEELPFEEDTNTDSKPQEEAQQEPAAEVEGDDLDNEIDALMGG